MRVAMRRARTMAKLNVTQRPWKARVSTKGKVYQTPERPLCVLWRQDGWVFAATLADIWHGYVEVRA